MRFYLPKIYVLIGRSFLAPFLGSYSVALFVLVLQFISRYQDKIFGKGFGADVIGQLFGYAALSLTVMALPIAVMIACLTTMGNLGERNELAALKASGVSLFRTIRPLAVMVGLIFIAALFMSSRLIPWANLQLFSLLYDVKKAKPEMALKPGFFDTSIEDVTIYYKERLPNGTLSQIKIWDHAPKGEQARLLVADSAYITTDTRLMYLVLTLFSGEQYEKGKPRKGQEAQEPFTTVHYDSLIYKLDISDFGAQRTEQDLFKKHYYMLSPEQLKADVDSLRAFPKKQHEAMLDYLSPMLKAKSLLHMKGLDSASCYLPTEHVLAAFSPGRREEVLQKAQEQARAHKNYTQYNRWIISEKAITRTKYDVELQRRYTFPAACLVLLLIGAPLGAIIRKGGLGLPVVIATLFFIVLYFMMNHGKELAVDGFVPVWVGAWYPLALMMLIAIYVTVQSATDSPLFDLSSYRILGRRILRGLGLLRQA